MLYLKEGCLIYKTRNVYAFSKDLQWILKTNWFIAILGRYIPDHYTDHSTSYYSLTSNQYNAQHLILIHYQNKEICSHEKN